MSNFLKNVQDLGGFCWDKYISETGENKKIISGNLILDSKLNSCSVGQINLSNIHPSLSNQIKIGETENFNKFRIINNFLKGKKGKEVYYNQIALNSSNSFFDIYISNSRNDLDANKAHLRLMSNSGFLEFNDSQTAGIHFYTDDKQSFGKLTSGAYSINIDTINISGKQAMFRCVKKNKKSINCLAKILSTKEIFLECCPSGIAGGGGAGGEGGVGGGGGVGVGGGIGLEGPGQKGDQGQNSLSDGIGGGLGLEGPISEAEGAKGPDGTGGQGGAGGAGVKGSDGIAGQGGIGGTGGKGSQGSIGVEGPKVIGKAGNPGGEGGIGVEGPTEKGEDGKAGEGGARGGNGSSGGTGGKGRDGSQGSSGGDGKGGATGGDGNKGSIGDKGAQGSSGSNGGKGAVGGNGEAGNKGSDGKIGYQGYQGFNGERGADGSPGSKGIDGEQGEFGKKGADGQQGPKGDNGLDIKGAIGLPGQKGPNGDDGQSPDGPIGATGGKGSQGAGGSPGTEGGKEYENPAFDYGGIYYVPPKAKIYLNGLSGFINPYNKNDTTNNPARGQINGQNL
jgi:hypothetical protein